jgi:hypothetical protein
LRTSLPALAATPISSCFADREAEFSDEQGRDVLNRPEPVKGIQRAAWKHGRSVPTVINLVVAPNGVIDKLAARSSQFTGWWRKNSPDLPNQNLELTALDRFYSYRVQES